VTVTYVSESFQPPGTGFQDWMHAACNSLANAPNTAQRER
jgi:hypothetical protein